MKTLVINKMAKFAKIIHQNNENFLITKFIRLFRSKIRNKGKRRFTFVLTGGDTPIKLYKHLARSRNINWRKIGTNRESVPVSNEVAPHFDHAIF